jgi:hypothetical protein
MHMERPLSSMVGRLKRGVLGLSPEEASFSRRGFPGSRSASRGHLERVIQTFIEGYNIAIDVPDMAQLAYRLDASFPPAFVGFAYEGVGLYFGLVDLLVPGFGNRLAAFTRSAGRHHDFIASVGAGFAIARTPFGLRRLESYQRTLDPMTSWCLADGYGFHEGFFHWKRFIEGREPPPRSLDFQGRSLFDAGVGRAMWWVFGADSTSIASAISRVDAARRPEMWAGIGTALAYAGGGPPGCSSHLLDLAGAYREDLRSGIPFAAHMRAKGRNPAEWTDEVCLEVLDRSAAETSGLIAAELGAYLGSWQGSEEDKWRRCYVALRDRVKRRLENERAKPPQSFAWANTAQ